ncbi:MAG: hypothetical protein KGL61_11865, partial [Burkholderiales bacterium]|nr:hypothetical protein [Burkholderiales bacterium]
GARRSEPARGRRCRIRYCATRGMRMNRLIGIWLASGLLACLLSACASNGAGGAGGSSVSAYGVIDGGMTFHSK